MLSQAASLRATDGDAPPLVIGFERFARHGELAPGEAGTLLLTELSCTACHAATQKSLEPKAGPKLDAAGRRLKAAWISAFLSDPAHTKPGTTMPDVLAGMDENKKNRAVSALVAFLSSQQVAFPELKASGLNPVLHEFWNKGNAANGKRLMHQTGCVTCHQPADDYEGGVQGNSSLEKMLEELEPEQIEKLGLTHAARTIPSIPMASAREKYTAQGLAMFLFDPASVRPAGRMPNMKLRTADAADITAYLMSLSAVDASAKPAASPTAANLRDEGQKLFVELGCANCHTAGAVKPKPLGKPLKSLNATAEKSCMASNANSGMPHFALDAEQRAAIANLLATLKQPTVEEPTAAEQVSLGMLQLNCYACHQRDGRGGVALGRERFFETVGQVDLGDEGRLPPPLTGVGKKLVSPWLKSVLIGALEIRPHLQIRMPKYAVSEADRLVPMLAKADGVDMAQGTKPLEAVDKTLAEAGRTIFNLGCVQCHPLRGESLPGVVGVEVGHIGARVRKQWFHDFLLNPASLKARTRMPTFFAEGSVNKEVLDGNVEKQIESLWVYLEDIDRQPLPEKIDLAHRQNFELVPKDKPIVLRTFMQLAGTHAIAVGFPEHVHYAFDSETVRLAELWGDRFLDAQGVWNDRMAPPSAPLTTNRIPLPNGADFGLLPNRNAPWPENKLDSPLPPTEDQPRFMGYSLDKLGVPQMQYQVGDYRISDRFTPGTGDKVQPHAIVRELVIKHNAPAKPTQRNSELWYRAVGSGKPLQRKSNSWVYASGLTVILPEPLAAAAFSRNLAGQSQVIVPIPAAAETRFSIEYRW